MIVAGTEKFVGLPFADHGREEDGLDCWGGVRYYLGQMRGLLLPDYGFGYTETADVAGIAATIRAGLMEGWQKIPQPEIFALVIFNLAGNPWHVGVMVSKHQFLHWPEDQNSRLDSIYSAMWEKRIEGYYRYVN